jgi:hypothetical protein
MERRNANAESMTLAALGLLSFMYCPSEGLDTVRRMGNEQTSRSGGHHSAIAAFEKRRLYPRFDLLELFAEGGFRNSKALSRLGHIARFMQGNDQFEVANSEVAGCHRTHTSARTNSGASPRQAGGTVYSPYVPPGNHGQRSVDLNSQQPYLP